MKSMEAADYEPATVGSKHNSNILKVLSPLAGGECGSLEHNDKQLSEAAAAAVAALETAGVASTSTATEQYYKETLGAAVAGTHRTEHSRSDQLRSADQRHEQYRKVSSTIIETQNLQTPPEDKVTYIDVPTYEEQVIYQTKKETRVIERKVDVPVHVRKEVIVEVKPSPICKPVYVEPTAEYVDEIVVREVKVPVPTGEPKIIYEDVQGEPKIIKEFVDVESVHWIDEPVDEIRYEDEEVPVIISQQIKPIFVESPNQHLDVEVVDYEPEVIAIDIHVAKPVQSMLRTGDVVESTHKLAKINSAQYNTILRRLNTHLGQEYISQLPYFCEDNKFNFVADNECQYIIAPSGIDIEGYKLRESAPQLSGASLHTASHGSKLATILVGEPASQNYLLTQPHYQSAPPINNYGRERGLANKSESTSEVDRAGRPLQSSRRICCDAVASEATNNTASIRSIEPSGAAGGSSTVDVTLDYATKQRANAQPSFHQQHLTSNQQTYPPNNRSHHNSTTSSIRVETVQSQQSHFQHRSRVCC